jgi:hypothetical protein
MDNVVVLELYYTDCYCQSLRNAIDYVAFDPIDLDCTIEMHSISFFSFCALCLLQIPCLWSNGLGLCEDLNLVSNIARAWQPSLGYNC